MSSSQKPSGSTSATENTLYETPALGVFITREGEIRREVLAQENILPIDALAADLSELTSSNQDLRVGDTPVHALSAAGGGDLANALGISKDFADSIKLMGEVIAVVSAVGAVASAVIKVMEVAGIFGEEANPFDDLYGRIEQRLRVNLKSTLAGQTLQTMQQINVNIGHSETAGSIVGAYLSHPTPAREALLPQAYYWSQYALNTLRGEALWLRTYDEEAATLKIGRAEEYGWEFGPVVRPDLLMWDWRLPLLAYLKALTVRIVVVHAIDPAVDAAHRAELLGHAQFLQTVEQRIRAGFSRSLPGRDLGWKHWEISPRYSCGVIEVQSGASDAVHPFIPLYWWKDPIETAYAQTSPQPATYEEYVKWHRNGTETRYWRLYDSLGLFALWSIIPDVQTAAKGSLARNALKDVFGNFKLTRLTENTGNAKMRLIAYSSWSEQKGQHPRGITVPAGAS